MVASVGEIRISWIGVWFQIAGLVFESMRVVMIQVLLSDGGEKMDPLVSLYYFAPVCGAMNLVMVWFTELGSFQVADFMRVGPFFLVFNAMVAFGLNVSSVFLVCFVPTGSTSDTRLHSLTARTDRKDKQSCHDTVRYL